MRIYLAILFSLLLHLLLKHGANLIALPQSHNKPIEVEILNVPNADQIKHLAQREKQFVRDTQVDQIDPKTSANPRFKSFTDRRVEKESQALATGITKNRSQQKQIEQKSFKKFLPKIKTFDGGAESPSSQTASVAKESIKRDLLDPGLSTVSEKLPTDIQFGHFTALNTERYIHYTFFARIEELIRFRWENRVRSAIDYLSNKALPYNRNSEWVSEIEIWLKENGEFHSAHLHKSSGIKAFDQAPEAAFKEARIFANPPKELVESDKLIRLKYAFFVRFSPKTVVNN